MLLKPSRKKFGEESFIMWKSNNVGNHLNLNECTCGHFLYAFFPLNRSTIFPCCIADEAINSSASFYISLYPVPWSKPSLQSCITSRRTWECSSCSPHCKWFHHNVRLLWSFVIYEDCAAAGWEVSYLCGKLVTEIHLFWKLNHWCTATWPMRSSLSGLR